jgi:mannose-6-phosphate isomerase-like protein (cupin superfamily)
VILAGEGYVVVDGMRTAVTEGSAVWIPEGHERYADNTGTIPLRLLYVFARDKFSDVTYSFPGEQIKENS